MGLSCTWDSSEGETGPGQSHLGLQRDAVVPTQLGVNRNVEEGPRSQLEKVEVLMAPMVSESFLQARSGGRPSAVNDRGAPS